MLTMFVALSLKDVLHRPGTSNCGCGRDDNRLVVGWCVFFALLEAIAWGVVIVHVGK